MPGLRTRYPCQKCRRQGYCAWLLRDLRNAVDEARLRGMRECDVPEIYVDCEGRYSPPALGPKRPTSPDH